MAGYSPFQPNRNPTTIYLGEVRASRLTVDPSGQFCALSSALEVTVFSLDEFTPKSRFSLNLKHDPTGLLWHPNDSTRLGLIRFNHCEILLWDTNLNRLSVQHSLSGYVRPITSFDWSPADPNLLITSSSDQFRAICVWDLRYLLRPARAMESLSGPRIAKWNRLSGHVFASLHRSDLRLWDLRTNHPEILPLERMPTKYSSSDSPVVVKNFDWSPKVGNELATIDQDGLLCLWNTDRLLGPCKQHHCGVSHVAKLLYSPSGDQIITLPSATNWSCHGLGVWSSANLQKPPSTLWNSDESCNASHCPTSSDPVVVDLAWRVRQLSGSFRTLDETPFTHDDAGRREVVTGDESVIQLVTLSADCALRIYPVRSAPTATISELITVTDTTPADPETRIGTVSVSHKPFVDEMSSGTVYEPSPSALHPVQTSALDSAYAKHSSGNSTPGNITQRSYMVAKTSLLPGGAKNDDVINEDIAYKFLAQELSLLSPPAGQYKLEEIDLINRNAKLTLFYCRQRHNRQNYNVCTDFAGIRDRSLYTDTEDSDSLLLPHTDLPTSLDNSVRLDQPGLFSHLNKSAQNFDINSGDEQRKQSSAAPGEHRNQHQTWGAPESGTVTISVSFPVTYPSTAATFSVLDHNPALPKGLLARLSGLLHTTASELAHRSRGCMDPCVRKAVDFLQSIPSVHSLISIGDSSFFSSGVIPESDKPQCHFGPTDAFCVDSDHTHRIRTPFPRLSGARFSAQGFLVAFGLRHHLNPLTSDAGRVSFSFPPILTGGTPRTLQDFCTATQRNINFGTATPSLYVNLRGSSDVTSSTMLTDDVDHRGTDKDFLSHSSWASMTNFQGPNSDTMSHDIATTQSNVVTNFEYIREFDLNPANSLHHADVVLTNEQRCKPLSNDAAEQLSKLRQSVVQVYDFSSWFVQKKLIQCYSLATEEVRQMCAHNYLVALHTGRLDIIRFWRYAIVLASSMTPHFTFSSASLPPPFIQPMGKVLFQQWLTYFVRLRDVQHLAMAVLVLSGLDALYSITPLVSASQQKMSVSTESTKPCLTGSVPGSNNSPSRRQLKEVVSFEQLYPSEQESTPTCVTPRAATVAFNLDASDESDLASVREMMTQDTPPTADSVARYQLMPLDPHTGYSLSVNYADRLSLVNRENLPIFAHYVASYADVLYSMRKFLRHARLLRSWAWCLQQYGAFRADLNLCPPCVQFGCSLEPTLSSPPLTSVIGCDICEMPIHSQVCYSQSNEPTITHNHAAQILSILCAICRMKAKGLVFLCPKCLHGGHVDHMLQWFGSVRCIRRGTRQCPTPDCNCCCYSNSGPDCEL